MTALTGAVVMLRPADQNLLVSLFLLSSPDCTVTRYHVQDVLILLLEVSAGFNGRYRLMIGMPSTE